MMIDEADEDYSIHAEQHQVNFEARTSAGYTEVPVVRLSVPDDANLFSLNHYDNDSS